MTDRVPGPPFPIERDQVEVGLRYAWDWFSYHANQRLSAFRFFLIMVAFITAGYGTSWDRKLYGFSLVLSIAGVLVSFAFFRLDRRNEELVNDGRDVLDELEEALKIVMRRRDHVTQRQNDRIPRGEAAWSRARTGRYSKHRFWFPTIEACAGLLFFIGIVLSLAKMDWSRITPVLGCLTAQ